jgi:acyl-CoA thioester hydrolase
VPSATPTLVQAIRWRDLDPLGHVNYATYLTYLEEARNVWLQTHVGLSSGHGYVVVRVEIDFSVEVGANDGPVTIDIELGRIGTTSLVLHERIRNVDSVLCAQAQVTVVLWDHESRQARPLSEAEHRGLAALSPAEG